MLDSLLKASLLFEHRGEANSPECVEGGFSELRLTRDLRTSALRSSRKFGAPLVLWRTYCLLRLEYTAFVTRPVDTA